VHTIWRCSRPCPCAHWNNARAWSSSPCEVCACSRTARDNFKALACELLNTSLISGLTWRGCSLMALTERAPASIVLRSSWLTMAVSLAGFTSTGSITRPAVAKLTCPFLAGTFPVVGIQFSSSAGASRGCSASSIPWIADTKKRNSELSAWRENVNLFFLDCESLAPNRFREKHAHGCAPAHNLHKRRDSFLP